MIKNNKNHNAQAMVQAMVHNPKILAALAVVTVAGFAGAAMQEPLQMPDAVKLQFAMQFVFAGCVLYSLQELVKIAARAEHEVLNVSGNTYNCSAKLAHIERRMETLVQDGRETARHLEQIFDEYNMEVSGGAVRWAQRMVLEQQMIWSTARNRFGELGSKRAWDLVVESSKVSLRARIGDNNSWSNDAKKAAAEARIGDNKKAAAKAMKLMEESVAYAAEAARLQKNMEHLEAYVPLLAGDKTVEDPMTEMGILVAEFEAMKKPEVTTAYIEAKSNGFYRADCAFTGRYIKEGNPAAVDPAAVAP